MNKHIHDLRNFKPPFWSRLLGDYRAWRRARAARKEKRHIATVTLWGKRISNDNSVNAWLHLFETSTKRSFKYEKGEFTDLDYTTFRCYHEVIIPWLHYKYSNKDIIAWAEKTKQRTT